MNLYNLAKAGDIEGCLLAIERGATDFDGMLCGAAESGDRNLCLLAIELGATGFNEMLSCATKTGHRDLCLMAIELGATDFNSMLRSAAFGGHRDLCLMAIELGATDFNAMLRSATRGIHCDLCLLAIKLGATDFHEMLKWAKNGSIKLLARYHIACTNYPLLPAHIWYAAIVMCCDDYYKPRDPLVRFVAIAAQLPMELQAILALRVVGSASYKPIGSNHFDEGCKWLLRLTQL